jgi:hypothetical protein
MKGMTLEQAANNDPKLLRNYINSFNPSLSENVEEIISKGVQKMKTGSKDDKKDYDHKERNKQPARNRTRFKMARVYSTSSSQDAGYLIMEIGWNPEDMKDMNKYAIGNHIVSYVKGLESDKLYHDFGVLGKPHIMDLDVDAGVARVKVRSSQSRGVMSLNYQVPLDGDNNLLPIQGIR